MPGSTRHGDRVGVAMIGAGSIAAYHLDGLAAAGGAAVRVVASRTAENARRLATRYGNTDWTGDWQAVLERVDVDAVIIATPDPTHELIALAAAAAGKHILLQKPMAGDSAACRRIAAAAERAGVDLQVSFMHRHFEEVQLARTLLREDAIGTVHTVRVRNATPGPNWGDWFFDTANVANGVVHQLGVHGVDLVSWLLGPIRDVSARMSIQQNTRMLRDGRTVNVGVSDTALASYGFVSGALGTHEMSMIEMQGCDRFRIEIYGQLGTLWLRSERGRLALWAPHLHGDQWWQPSLAEVPLGQHHHAQWLDGITGRAARAHTARDASAGMQVLEAIARSARQASAVVPVADRYVPAGNATVAREDLA
ncbi:MAG: Gfo/Idh/MocA family oxidoreductase [Burkholderiaceae bacterium]